MKVVVVVVVVIVVACKQISINSLNSLCEAIFSSSVVFQGAVLLSSLRSERSNFGREATGASVPLSGRRRPENVSILSSLLSQTYTSLFSDTLMSWSCEPLNKCSGAVHLMGNRPCQINQEAKTNKKQSNRMKKICQYYVLLLYRALI